MGNLHEFCTILESIPDRDTSIMVLQNGDGMVEGGDTVRQHKASIDS
jgi:hypothetical protein